MQNNFNWLVFRWLSILGLNSLPNDLRLSDTLDNGNQTLTLFGGTLDKISFLCSFDKQKFFAGIICINDCEYGLTLDRICFKVNHNKWATHTFEHQALLWLFLEKAANLGYTSKPLNSNSPILEELINFINQL